MYCFTFQELFSLAIFGVTGGVFVGVWAMQYVDKWTRKDDTTYEE